MRESKTTIRSPFLALRTAGLVFNPATPLDHAKYVLDKVDIILLMSVNPGFGGQSFIPSTLDKLREARKMIDESGYDIRLEVLFAVNVTGSPPTTAEVGIGQEFLDVYGRAGLEGSGKYDISLGRCCLQSRSFQ